MGIAINLSIFSSQSTTKQAFSVGGIYHVTVRLSLEPDRHFLGRSGLWRFAEKAVGAACWKVRFQHSRTVTFDTQQPIDFDFTLPESRHSPSSATHSGPSAFFPY
jgi:hypothetical protein